MSGIPTKSTEAICPTCLRRHVVMSTFDDHRAVGRSVCTDCGASLVAPNVRPASVISTRDATRSLIAAAVAEFGVGMLSDSFEDAMGSDSFALASDGDGEEE